MRAHQLEKRSNYLVWRRHFERTGKVLDVWDILSGNENVIKDEPTEDTILSMSEPALLLERQRSMDPEAD